MRIAVALALGALVAAGCSRPANKKLDELADRACACKDLDCARKIGADYAAWRKEYAGAPGDQAQAERAEARLTSCLTKVSGDKPIEKAIDKVDPSQKGTAKPADGADKSEGKPADGADSADKANTGDKPADK